MEYRRELIDLAAAFKAESKLYAQLDVDPQDILKAAGIVLETKGHELEDGYNPSLSDRIFKTFGEDGQLFKRPGQDGHYTYWSIIGENFLDWMREGMLIELKNQPEAVAPKP